MIILTLTRNSAYEVPNVGFDFFQDVVHTHRNDTHEKRARHTGIYVINLRMQRIQETLSGASVTQLLSYLCGVVIEPESNDAATLRA